MGTPAVYDVPDLGGGLAQGQPATRILDKQFVDLYNQYPYGTRLRRRDGTRKLTDTIAPSEITGFYPYKTALGEWTLLCGLQDGVGKLDGTEITQLASVGGITIPSTDDPWSFLQYKDVVYGFRKNAGRMKRITATTFADSGLDSPATYPSGAESSPGAGALENGDYRYVVTHMNTTTGVESNPSDELTVTVAAGPSKITLSDIPICPNSFGNARKIYRTVVDQVGQYFLVAIIADNTTTTYEDNVITNDLGASVSFDNGLPPTGTIYGELFYERLFSTDGRDLFYSEIGLAECNGFESILSIYPDDGQEIRGLRAWGDRLIVGKTNKMHYLTGTNPSNFELRTLSDRHGCHSFYSLQVAEGNLIWFGGDGFYRSTGGAPESISTRLIDTFVDNIPEEGREYVFAAIYPRLSLYIAAIPQDSTLLPKVAVAFNYKTGAWCAFDLPTATPGEYQAPQCLTGFYDENYGHRLYCTANDGYVYEFMAPESNGQDQIDGASSCCVPVRVKSKRYQLEKPGAKKALRRLHILTPSMAEEITLHIYRNGSSTPYLSRTARLDSDTNEWKRYSLSNLHAPTGDIQVGWSYGGTRELEINELAFEVVEFERRGRVH